MSLFIPPVVRGDDANGNPLSGAEWFFYETGTTTPATIYADAELTTPLTNPVVADDGGLFVPVYIDPAVVYRSVLKTGAGTTIQDIDPYNELAATISWVVDTRNDLEALPTSDQAVMLLEAGRQGVFVFDSSNLSAEVTADPEQGIYVAPAATPSGASGAWVRQFTGSIPAKIFGVTGDGVTNDTAALQAALNYASFIGGGVVRIDEGATVLHAAFNVPNDVVLEVAGDLVADDQDIDFVTVGQNSKLLGVGKGKLDLSNLSAFTNSAVVIPSTTVSWLDSGSEVDIDIIGIDPGAAAAPTGTAVEIKVAATSAHRVSFCRIAGNHEFFHTGLACDIPVPASGVNFASSNRVEAVYYDVVDAVRGTIASANSSMGAWAFDYVVQAQSTKATLNRGLKWEGAGASGHIVFWDTTSSVTVDNKPVEFTSDSSRNEITIQGLTTDQIINRSVTARPNRIKIYGGAEDSIISRTSPPMSATLPVGIGLQDDHFAYASTRSGWTITTSVAVSTGSVANMFNPIPNNFGRWAALNGVLEIKIDLGASVTKPHVFGVIFDYTAYPDKLLIETSTDDVSYTTLYDKTASNSASPTEVWSDLGGQNPARYVKFTITNDTAKDLIIYRIWGNFASVKGNAFAERYQPNVESQLSVDGTKVLGPRETGWSVDTGTAKRTANATYVAGSTLTFTDPPTAGEMTALATRLAAVEAALQNASQTIKALKDDLHATAGHGLIGT